MRVMMLNPSFSGGGYVHNLCNALVAQGVEVELATSPHFLRSSRGWTEVAYTPRIWFYRWTQLRSYARGPLRPIWQVLRFMGHNWTMWRIFRQARRFDVIHAHFPPVLLVDVRWLRAIARRTALVHTVHNLYPHDSGRTRQTRRLLRQLYRDATRDGLLHEFGVAPDHVVKVPFGNYGHMVPDLSRAHSDSPPVSSTTPVVLFFGEIRVNKGLDVLIEAAALLRDQGVRFRVLVAGQPGVPVDEYREQLKRLGLDKLVEFRVGYIEEDRVAAIFADAAVVALPYTAIDHSAVAITATTLGRALVASELAGLAELVRGAGNGLLVPPSDSAALAVALGELITNDALRQKREHNSREYASRELSWPPIAQLTRATYERARASRVNDSTERRESH